MSAVDMLLAQLDGVQGRGPRWRAICPAHESRHRTRTLSILEADDGRVLLRCHAGCEAAAIVAAVGLDLADLFRPQPADGLYRGGWRAGSHIGRVNTRPGPLEPQTIVRETLAPQWSGWWRQCAPIRGSIAELYLHRRGCIVPPPDGDLRFAPRAWHWIERRELAAMVALLTDAVTGEPQSLHLTYLRADGSGKANVERTRLLLPKHRKSGCVARLWPDESVTTGLLVAEGIETALAAAHGYRPVWACLDAGNLAAFPVLAGVESIVIAADHDDAGLRAARACAERWHAAGREVRVAMSDHAGHDLADEVIA